MAILYGNGAGGTFIKSSGVLGEKSYNPVFMSDSPATQSYEVDFIYNLLPSFYRDLMSDQKVFSSAWTGCLHMIGSDLLNLWHTEYSISSKKVLEYNQRKWQRYEFLKKLSLSQTFTIAGLFTDTSYTSGQESIGLTVTNRGGIDFVGDTLSGSVSEVSTLSWAGTFSVDAAEDGAVLCLGYGTTSTGFARNFLGWAIKKTSYGIQPYILHADGVGKLTSSPGSIYLSLQTKYTISCEYTSDNNVAKMEVYNNEYIKGQSAALIIQGTAEFSKVLEDPNATFTTGSYLVEVGDTVFISFGGRTLSALVTSATPTKLYLDRYVVPVNMEISYKVYGVILLYTQSLNIAGTATDHNFASDRFGIFNYDTQALSPISTDKNVTLTISMYSWEYLLPLLPTAALYLPRMQYKITDSTGYLSEGADYTISGENVYFASAPTGVLYAENVAYDEGTMHANFGSLLGIPPTYSASTEDLKRKIRGLLYSYLKGPTVNSIVGGVNLHLGLPIAEEAGTVSSINDSYSGSSGQIVIGDEKYLYPLSAGLSVSEGDAVVQFQPLCHGVSIKDYIIDPLWFDTNTNANEVQKYHSFIVELNMSAFEIEKIKDAFEFVRGVKPTWKNGYFMSYKDLKDELTVTDLVSIPITAGFVDNFCPQPNAMWDQYEARSPYEYDWFIDQGWRDFDYIPGSIRKYAELYTRNLFWAEGTIPEKKFLTSYSTLTNSVVDQFEGTDTYFIPEVGKVLKQGSTCDVEAAGAHIDDSTASFLTEVPNSGGTPDEETWVTVKTSSQVGNVITYHPYYARVSSVSSNTRLLLSSPPSELNGLAGKPYEIRCAAPKYLGTLLKESTGTGSISNSSYADGEGTFIQTSGFDFVANIPTDAFGEVKEDTYINAIPGGAVLISFRVSSVVSSTTVQVVRHETPYDTQSLSNADWVIFKPDTSLVLYLTDSGDATVIAGESLFTATTSSAFAEFDVGDHVIVTDPSNTDAGEFAIIEKSSNQVVRLDHEFSQSGTFSWVVYKYANKNAQNTDVNWFTVTSVPSNTKLTWGSTPPAAIADKYVAAVIDAKYKNIYFDYFHEICPDETLVLVFKNLNPSGSGGGVGGGVSDIFDNSPSSAYTTYNPSGATSGSLIYTVPETVP